MMMPLLGQLRRLWWRVVSAVIVTPHFGCGWPAASAPLKATRAATAKARITASKTNVAGAAWRRSLAGIRYSVVWVAQGFARAQSNLHPAFVSRKPPDRVTGARFLRESPPAHC